MILEEGELSDWESFSILYDMKQIPDWNKPKQKCQCKTCRGADDKPDQPAGIHETDQVINSNRTQ